MSAGEAEPPADAGQVLIYHAGEDGSRIDMRLAGETVWLTQQQMADLFGTTRTNIAHHIRNIYDEDELTEAATCEDFSQVRLEGSREVARSIPHYNLDMIISLG